MTRDDDGPKVHWTAFPKASWDDAIELLAAAGRLTDEVRRYDLVHALDEAGFRDTVPPSIRALKARWRASREKVVQIVTDASLPALAREIGKRRCPEWPWYDVRTTSIEDRRHDTGHGGPPDRGIPSDSPNDDGADDRRTTPRTTPRTAGGPPGSTANANNGVGEDRDRTTPRTTPRTTRPPKWSPDRVDSGPETSETSETRNSPSGEESATAAPPLVARPPGRAHASREALSLEGGQAIGSHEPAPVAVGAELASGEGRAGTTKPARKGPMTASEFSDAIRPLPTAELRALLARGLLRMPRRPILREATAAIEEELRRRTDAATNAPSTPSDRDAALARAVEDVRDRVRQRCPERPAPDAAIVRAELLDRGWTPNRRALETDLVERLTRARP